MTVTGSEDITKTVSNAIMTRPYKNMEYTHEMDLFFSEIGEDCHVISLLHMMCHRMYKNKETWFNIPIITITAFVGFISGLNLSYEYMHIIVGVLSLSASLLKSYFSYLKISQKGENHRISYIQYGQIYSDIQVELALEPKFRQNPSSLMNLVRVKLKNLNEVSEIIHEDIKRELETKITKLYYFESDFFNNNLQNSGNTGNTGNTTVTKTGIRKPGILDIVKRIKLYEDYETLAYNRYQSNAYSHYNNVGTVGTVFNNGDNDSRTNGAPDNENDNRVDSDNDINNDNSVNNNSVTGSNVSNNKMEIELNQNVILSSDPNGLLV